MLRLVRFALTFCLFCAAGISAAHADSLTYDFTYTGGNFIGSVTGNGSLSFNYTPGSTTAALTSFSFTDTIMSGNNSSTFMYDINDLSRVLLGVTTTGQLRELGITTFFEKGTNSNFGLADFSLNFNGILDGTAGTKLADYSAGTGSMNVAAAPEPSSMLLLGTGLMGMAGIVRRKLGKS